MNRTRPQDEASDRGAAMVLIISAVAIISALSITVATASLNNLRNTTRDKQAGSAFATAEAGVAAVINRIRSGELPLTSFKCLEPADPATPLPAGPCTDPAMSWSSSVNPMAIDVATGSSPCTASANCYKVWVGAVSPFSPPSTRIGIYRVHSRGFFGNGPAARTVVTEIKARPEAFPIGVYGEAVTGNGGTAVYNESMFTRACVSPRATSNGNGTRFSGTDVYWDQPAAAHSTTMISTAVNCSSSGNIHAGANDCPSDPALFFDQSANGGPISTTSACYTGSGSAYPGGYTRADGSRYPDALPSDGCTPRADGLCDSTKFTTADLARYGYIPRGLTDAQYARLKAKAEGTGTYNVAAANLNAKLTAAYDSGNGITQPVVYIDCAVAGVCSNGTYTFGTGDFPDAFKQAPDSGTSMARCASGAQPVVTIVIEHGNAVFSAGNNAWLDAAIFVPDGQWRGNGGYNILGTMFTNDLSLGGNETFQLDKCFVRDIPAPLLAVDVVGFREDDARDVS